MSWIKPNFLWMMYRCGWGTKPDQKIVLAIRLRRTGFDELLAQTVPSRFDLALYAINTGQRLWMPAFAGITPGVLPFCFISRKRR